MKKRLLSAVFLLTSIIVLSQTTVTTDTGLQQLVNAAAPGAVFVVPNGTYADFYSSFTKIATADKPITIKAETVGGVILTGDSHFVFKKSAHIILEGFVFDCTSNNSLIKLEASNNIRITRNVFELSTSNPIKWIVVTGTYNDYTFQFLSHHNRIDHNIFKNKNTPGNYITIDGTYNLDKTVNQQSQYDRIDHNYFYKMGPRVENEMEALRIGNSQLSASSGYTTVDFNLFEECDGDPEMVSVKSCDNRISHNTFTKSYGSLTLRQGKRNTVVGNYFFGGGRANGKFETSTIYTGGIRVYGTDHVIINNYLEGLKGTIFDAPITLNQGDAIEGVDTDQSLHYRAERIIIANNTLVNNTYGIEIGYAKSDGSWNRPLKDITIANNLITGSENSMVKIHNNQLGEVKWFNNVVYPTGSAVLNANGYTFTSDEIAIQNPNLALVGSIWKSTNATPSKQKGTSLNIDSDIEGQTRPTTSTVGADYFSNSTVLYNPIGINDVGPNVTETVLSVQQNESSTEVKMYPNPASKVIYIQTNLEQIQSVTINSIAGGIVLKNLFNFSEGIDVSSLTPGIYLVQVQTNNGVYIQKLIIK